MLVRARLANHPRYRCARVKNPCVRSPKICTHPGRIAYSIVGMRSPAKRQTVQYAIWVKPSVKAEFQRLADAEGLTLSHTGSAALEEWLARRSHLQHRGIFQPMIERAIAREMRTYSNRITKLLVRSMFASEQTRALATNILGRQPGVSQAVLEHILDGTSDTAKRNITRVTPQLAALVTEIDAWLVQGVRDGPQ